MKSFRLKTNLNTKSYLPDFYKEKKVIKRSKRDESMLSDDENNDTEVNEMIVTTANAADDPEPSTKKRQRSRAVQPPSSSSEATDNDEDQSTQIEEKENARKTRKRKVSPMKRSDTFSLSNQIIFSLLDRQSDYQNKFYFFFFKLCIYTFLLKTHRHTSQEMYLFFCPTIFLLNS